VDLAGDFTLLSQEAAVLICYGGGGGPRSLRPSSGRSRVLASPLAPVLWSGWAPLCLVACISEQLAGLLEWHTIMCVAAAFACFRVAQETQNTTQLLKLVSVVPMLGLPLEIASIVLTGMTEIWCRGALPKKISSGCQQGHRTQDNECQVFPCNGRLGAGLTMSLMLEL
jgi:hypothetical protein